MSRSIRILIVDDEPLSRERIRALLESVGDVEVCGECGDGLEALQKIESLAPDLVFLDVQMPHLSGLDVAEMLDGDTCPHVVFVSAYDRYLQRAFDVHALDYLRKPFTDQRFYDALQHARRRIDERHGYQQAHAGVAALVEELRQRSGIPASDRLVLRGRGNGVFRVIAASSVDWIEKRTDGVHVHVGKDVHATHHTLTELERRLAGSSFLRIHRSLIVNTNRILTVEHLWKGEYEIGLEGGTRLTSGRTYRGALEGHLALR
jgi:two-component system, LytTR family, response regulator